MINAAHAVIWSEDPGATREFFSDVLEFDSVDAGGGWLVYALPPAELGIHPTDPESAELRHELYLMCDDIESTVADLESKGVEIASPVEDQGFGLVASIRVPGAGELALYEPRHPSPLDL